jgi:hypothetical protein
LAFNDQVVIKENTMQRLFKISTSLLLAAAAVAAAPGALANNVNWSVSVGSVGPVYAPPPAVYVQPEPIYVQPSPVYVQPRPVYVRPAPVIVQPAAVVRYGPTYYVEERHGHGHAYGHWKHHHHD